MKDLVQVFYTGAAQKQCMGRLAIKDRTIYFEYDPEFLASGLMLSPFLLPLKPGVLHAEDRLFDGLFGIFNDSLPDGWGRLLLDRKLRSLGRHPGSLSPVDRLMYVGSAGMGALAYEPMIENQPHAPHDDLDHIAHEIYTVLELGDDQYVEDLLEMNGSSAGARPKVLLDDWIIKFRSSIDAGDAGPIEYAYHLMAQKAGLEVPDAKVFSSKTGPGYFGSKRFDRQAGKHLHMHSLSGLIHADHRIPSVDYETLMKVTMLLTKNHLETEKQYRQAVFNVLTHNRDDHAKNFSFLMDAQGIWRVSPAYDLTFSYGPGGEHCTLMMGEGKHPTQEHFLKLAEVSGIKPQRAKEIIEEVKEASSQWKACAIEAGVSQGSITTIGKLL